jgi:hypothetical protein
MINEIDDNTRKMLMSQYTINDEQLDVILNSGARLRRVGLRIDPEELVHSILGHRPRYRPPVTEPQQKSWLTWKKVSIIAMILGLTMCCSLLFASMVIDETESRRSSGPILPMPTLVVETPEPATEDSVQLAPTATISSTMISESITPTTAAPTLTPTPFPTWTPEPVGLDTGDWRNIAGFGQLERSDLADGRQRHMAKSLDGLAVLEIIGSLDSPTTISIMFDIPDTEPEANAVGNHLVEFLRHSLPNHHAEAEQWMIDNMGDALDNAITKVYGNAILEVEIVSILGLGFATINRSEGNE